MSALSFLRKIAHVTDLDNSDFSPVLGSPQRLGRTLFQFTFVSMRGVEFDIQATTNLKDWVSIGTGIGSGQTTEFIDEKAAHFGSRFYRVVAGDKLGINVIGYVTLTLPPGFSLIANPLNFENNTVGSLFKNWPDGTTLTKFDRCLFRLVGNAVNKGDWKQSSETLVPGEGAIFYNPTSEYKWHCFVGEVVQGKHSIPLPSGFLMCATIVPQRGDLQKDLGFPIAEGDVVHTFDSDQQKYIIYPFGGQGWENGSPTISPGESFWVAKKDANNWTRDLAV